MNITTIEQAFEFLSAKGESQALADAVSAYAISKAELEELFYTQCWGEEGAEVLLSDSLAYSIELSHIEEFLVNHGLIYETWDN